MKPASKILLLTDFSEVAANAASFAEQIASKTNGHLEVIHFVPTPVNWIKLPKEREHLYPETNEEIAKSRGKLSVLVADFRRSGIEAEATLVFSYGPENVFSHIENSKADLLIMGSHGQGGARGLFLGSNAQKVLRNVKIPTLIVKKAPLKDKIHRIAFLTTLEEDQAGVYTRLKSFAELLDAEIDLVFVNTPYNFFETRDSDIRFSGLDPQKSANRQILINAYNTESGILYFTEAYHPDLLVMVKSHKPGMKKIFSASLTENLIRELDLPVLSVCME